MTWECAECHATEVRDGRRTRIDWVCHHCGKPLCRDDRLLVPDLAFAHAAGEVGAEAAHCRSCKRRYHGTDLSIGAAEP